MPLIDLSHPISDGMMPYPGFPSPKIGAHLDHATSRERYHGKAEFFIGKVDMVGNVGTYIDSPFHRHPDGQDLASLPLASIASVPGYVIDARPAAGKVDITEDAATLRGRAVLFRTGWDERWGTTEYYAPGPFLSGPTIAKLVAAPARLVGVDFWNVDDTTDPSRPAHTVLLAAQIPIVEHLTRLDQLPRDTFTFTAVPPPIVRGASFPVRAFAEIP